MTEILRKDPQMSASSLAPDLSGLAPINGLQLYYESYGAGGTPLILLHGGYLTTGMFGELAPKLAVDRRVIAVDLQGHGRTADIERTLSLEGMAEDIAALIDYLDLGQVDVLGYSLGGGVALRTTLDHPELVRRLVLISTPFSRSGWLPEIREQMKMNNRNGFDFMRQTPLYTAYAAVAPNPDAFPDLMDKMGALLARDYDWSDEVRALTMPVLLAFGDADSIPVTHAAEFFALLGGGQRDGGWDGSGIPSARLAILPGTTHYNSFSSPLVEAVALPFLR
jgi:pimeloyl-ACP methyl ester carboxylesterase